VPERKQRKHIRLQDYDYNREGLYFVTICTKDRRGLLGKISESDTTNLRVSLSKYGEIVDRAVQAIPAHYDGVSEDKYVIMPNHIHLILLIEADDNSDSTQAAHALLSTVITALKRVTSKAAGFNLWQSSFYDHVIRNEEDYQRIWDYIDTNPKKWVQDRFFTGHAE